MPLSALATSMFKLKKPADGSAIFNIARNTYASIKGMMSKNAYVMATNDAFA